MAKSSSNVKLTTTDAHERARDYLDADEMDRLLAAAKKSTQGIRDYALLLMMYHHGLRVSEATMMRRDALMGDNTRVWVERLKGSLSTEQPIEGAEQKAIKRYLATREDNLPWLFVSRHKTQLSRQAVNFVIAQAGKRAGLGHVHPHMLRHSCGYYLANRGVDFRTTQDLLGHRDPKHTTRYTRVAARRFEGIWT